MAFLTLANVPGADDNAFGRREEIKRMARLRKGAEVQMTDIQLLDEQEVSKRLSVSVNTLRYWRVSGDGPNYVKLGRLVRYDAVALEKFVERNLRVPKARAITEEKRVAL